MPLDVTLDRYTVMVNGRREFILCGAMHYFRLPGRELWPQRLALLKDAGFNAVDIYYPWNYHSPAQGEYDFTGIRDVDYLHRCIEDAGLYLIARPGPYICAEIDAGGLPGWLLAQKHLALRCRDNGRFQYDPKYIEHVREWFHEIVPRIAACKNLLLFQVENEYNLLPHLQGAIGGLLTLMRRQDPAIPLKLMGSDLIRLISGRILPRLSSGPREKDVTIPYFKDLNAMAREFGIKVPTFHNDIMSVGGRATEVDFMAVDDYPMNMFSGDWRGKRHLFATTDAIEQGHDAYRGGEPVFIAEYQGSWYDLWGGGGYGRIRDMFGPEQLDIITKNALAQRATLINYFMFIGGTSWGYLSSPDVYTSYDMAAPVAESGLPTERYETLKRLAAHIRDLGSDFLETELDLKVRATNSAVDSLVLHYGCVWYHGIYDGRIPRVRIDARHCFSLWLNGRLVASRDNFHNRLGTGPDFPQTFTITLPASFHNESGNTLVLLVESLGHHKDFEADARNPRGLISFKLSSNDPLITWRRRGGLLPGEHGLCPVLAPESFAAAGQKTPVKLPHLWHDYEEGVGLYETAFDLNGTLDPTAHALGLVIPDAFSKVNIYLNGALIGRYWQEKGPQHKFYLPWGFLKPAGENHLALAVWKRWNKGGLGRVRLELY